MSSRPDTYVETGLIDFATKKPVEVARVVFGSVFRSADGVLLAQRFPPSELWEVTWVGRTNGDAVNLFGLGLVVSGELLHRIELAPRIAVQEEA